MTTNEKIAALRSAMQAAGANACLIPSSDPHINEEDMPDHWMAQRYFSGFTGGNSTLIVTDQESALWVDGRYYVQGEQQLAGSEIQLQRMKMPGVPTVTEYLQQKLGEGQVLAVDGFVNATTKVQEWQQALAQKGALVKDVDVVSECWQERPALPSTEAWILEDCFAGESSPSKIQRLREKLCKAGATAEVVTRLDSIAWLLNLRAADIECTPFALSWAFVNMEKTVLFINSARLNDAAQQVLAQQQVEVRDYQDLPTYLAGCTGRETVLVDVSSTNYAVYNAVKQNAAFTMVEAADPIQCMKGVKSAAEMANIRIAHEKDGVAMVRFQMELEEKMAGNETVTECDIGKILYQYRSAQDDFLMESFPTIAAYGANAAMMHYFPLPNSCATLQHKGFLLVDSGAQYKDGTTDITRTYALGELTEQEKWWYTMVLKCHINMARCVFLEGCTGGNLDIIARQNLWKHGIDYRCGTGHGVGFVGAVHEGPQSLRTTNNVAFVPGMTVTDEPGVYETDQVGIRIESELHCIPWQENQYGKFLCFEDFTYCPIDLTPVLPDLLEKEEKEWLNGYHKMVFDKLSPRLTQAETDWLAEKTRPLI